MRRPDRNFVLSLLAFAATFAQGWQREREARIEASSRPLPIASAPMRPPLRALAERAPRERRAESPLTLRSAELDALLDRMFELDPAEWTDADVDALHRALDAGDPMAALLLVDLCRVVGDCRRLGPALEARGAAGDADAALLLSELYTEPDFPGADPVRAFGWLARYAELGDAEAKRDAAFRTLEFAPDDRAEWRAQALAWLAAAASGGSARAALDLLKLSEGGRYGLAADPLAATRWYDALRLSADPPLLREAAIHFQGRGDVAGFAQAVELWTQQGELGGEFGSNNAAWLLAVCGSGLGDHERAWRLVQLEHRDHGETWQSVDTLAGVQAQLGMWGEALATQQRALDLLAAEGGSDAAERELRARFDGYGARRAPVDPGLCPQPR